LFTPASSASLQSLLAQQHTLRVAGGALGTENARLSPRHKRDQTEERATTKIEREVQNEKIKKGYRSPESFGRCRKKRFFPAELGVFSLGLGALKFFNISHFRLSNFHHTLGPCVTHVANSERTRWVFAQANTATGGKQQRPLESLLPQLGSTSASISCRYCNLGMFPRTSVVGSWGGRPRAKLKPKKWEFL
jgi:hypothetical protein